MLQLFLANALASLLGYTLSEFIASIVVYTAYVQLPLFFTYIKGLDSALIMAAREGHVQITAILIESGATIDITNEVSIV